MNDKENVLDIPVCVLICLFNNEGLSKAFPQTSQGNSALSDFAGLLCILGVISKISLEPTDDDVRESPETDLCSSSVPDGGDIGNNTRDKREVERSNGESENRKQSFIRKFE